VAVAAGGCWARRVGVAGPSERALLGRRTRDEVRGSTAGMTWAGSGVDVIVDD